MTWSHKSKHERSKIETIQNIISEPLILFKQVFNIDYTFCGSYRRNKEIIGDIDIVICNDNNINLFDHFKTFLPYLTKLIGGKVKASYLYNNDVQVDIRICNSSNYIFHILRATGSADENKRLSFIAKRKGYTLSEYGLRDIYTNSYVQSLTTEKDIYEFLDIKYKYPSER